MASKCTGTADAFVTDGLIFSTVASVGQIIEKMNGQGTGAETIPFSVAVKAQGNIEDWLCDLLFKMQVLSLTPVIMYASIADTTLFQRKTFRWRAKYFANLL